MLTEADTAPDTVGLELLLMQSDVELKQAFQNESLLNF